MKILIIITGSVGCYKSLDLVRECQKKSIEYEVLQQKTLMSLFLNYYLKQFPISQCIQSSLIWIWKKKLVT